MLRATVNEKQSIITEEAPIPQPQDGEMTVRVECALAGAGGGAAGGEGSSRSLACGLSGTVHSAGAGVTAFRAGQQVMFTLGCGCHECPACERGNEGCCGSYARNTVRYGMAQYVLLPAAVVRYNTFLKPDSLSFAQAAFLDPLARLLNGLRRIRIGGDDTVVILGSGYLSLLLLRTLKAAVRPRAVAVCGIGEHRLQKARELGADYTIDPQKEDLTAAVMRITEGYGAQAVIDTASIPAAWDSMLGLASKAASLLFCGDGPSGHKLQLDATRVHYDQMTLCGVCGCSSADALKACELLSQGTVDPAPMIGASFPLAEAGSAFLRLTDGQDTVCTVIP